MGQCECRSKKHAKDTGGRPCHAMSDGRRCGEEAKVDVEVEVRAMSMSWDQVRRRVVRWVRMRMCVPCADWNVERGAARRVAS